MQSAEISLNLDNLDAAQKSAVLSDSTRLCIVAPAGSGKTRVMVKRIEHLCKTNKCLPNQVVAITFTRKAGFELAHRLAKSFTIETRERPFVGTLHSFALSELSKYHDENNSKMDSILEDPTALLKSLKVGNPTKALRAISWCKTRLMRPADINEETIRTIKRCTHMSTSSFDANTFRSIYEQYQQECKKRRLMDHDEVLLRYHQKLQDSGYAQTRRYIYRHIFVDEFQDTTPLHMEIFRSLVGENGAISVVGDPDQSIFSFAGASDIYLNNFQDFFPGAQTVFLNTNYRSTRANVEVARSVLLGSENPETIKAPKSSTALPKIHVFSDEQSESEGVVEIISTAHARGIPLREIAVLVRTNAQKDIIVQAAKRLGLPLNRGRQIISDPVANEVWKTIVSLRKKRRWKSIYDALDDIDGAQTITGELDSEHKDLFSKLRRSAREYMELFPNDRHGDVSGFFEYIEFSLTANSDSAKGFSLLTFHQAKGLEFDTVIVCGFEKGLVPLYNDKIRKAEEARLAYVAMSRAINELYITRACVRMRHGNPIVTQPSDFLKPIQENITQIDIRNDIFTPQEAIKRIADIRAKYLIKKL